MTQMIVIDEVVEALDEAIFTAHGAVEARPVAYTLAVPGFGEFPVAHSYRAWWMDAPKVAAVFDAYKAGATDEAACISAKISIKQLRDFREAHPDFGQAKELCKHAPELRFLNALNTNGPDDLPTVRWWLSRRHPDFKGKVDDGEEKPLGQSARVQVAQTVVVQNKVDAGAIIEAVRAITSEVLASPDGGAGLD